MNQWWLPENLQRLAGCHSMHWKGLKERRSNRLLCGAQCRDGHACKSKAVVNPKTNQPINGRCRIHGGLSSGAKTEEGKERCRQAAKEGMLRYWQKKKNKSQ